VSRSLRVALQLAVLVLPLYACAQLTFSAKEIRGTIVDADTGQPLEGVNIVAQWKINRISVGDEKALLHVTETVTDKDGRYAFPAWGPIGLPPLADFGKGQDPVLSIFKSGYDPDYLLNEMVSDMRYRRTPLGEFMWNGTTTKLKKWNGDMVIYARRIGSMAGGLPYRTGKEWKSYPKMAVALDRENKKLVSIGNFNGGSVPGFFIEDLSKEDKEYLNKHAQ
jgi:hypothetical protein